MIDIDEYAREAIASPVTEPPDMATLVALAAHHRRKRRSLRTTLALGVCAVVAAILALSALPTDDSGLRVIATAPTTATSTTLAGTSNTPALTIPSLAARLKSAGRRVAADGTASGYPLGVDAHLLCVDGIQVRVYQYANAAARAAISAGISDDGSSIDRPSSGSTTRVIVEWIGPPHFFARGRVIVLVLQDDDQLQRDLARILGPTLSPQAARLYGHKSPCTSKTQ